MFDDAPPPKPLFSAAFDEDLLHGPTRTQLTSQADLTPPAGSPPKINHVSTWLMFGTVLATMVATVWRAQPLPLPAPVTAAPPAPPVTVEPIAPPVSPVTIEIAPSTSASASVAPEVPPPRQRTRQPRPSPKRARPSPREKSPGF